MALGVLAACHACLGGEARGAARLGADGGERLVVGEVSFEGVSRFSREDLLERCPGLRRGAPFTREGLESAFGGLLRAYGADGYAECRVFPKSFAPDAVASSVDFTVEVAEGQRRLVERVIVSGGKTQGRVAARIAGLESGSPFDPWGLERARERLSASGLFSQVDPPIAKRGRADSLVVIEIPVKEPPSSSAGGLLGYSGREGGAVGFIDLDLQNIMGTRRAASLRWENSGGGLSSYSAGYREPWLGGLPASLELGIEHLAQDTTYSTTGFTADIVMVAGRTLSLAVGIGREKTALAASAAGSVTRRSRLALRAAIQVDARDDPVNPRNGFLVGVKGDWGSRHDGGPDAGLDRSWSVAHVDVGGGVHRRLHGRHGLYLGARWRAVVTDEETLPPDQLLRFGGAASLRGYKEDQFRAERTALMQLEHRIALGDEGSMIFVFTDVGVVKGAGAQRGALVGYGLGMRAATRGGVVGLDFGLGRGDSWSQGKVHVRMRRTF